MADKPRPEERKRKKKGKITVGQINGRKALIGGVAFESKVDNFITPRLAH